MEVHHSHPNHKPKKLKEYFLEFLMLFLAVTLGFFAESYREHLVETSREKEFVKSFIEDLKIDTASINSNIGFRKMKLEHLDSLMYLLSTQKIKGYENDLYYLSRVLIRTNKFQSNDRTITQLRNSGSLRLIRNEQAADSMLSYQKMLDALTASQEDERIERSDTYPILSSMFNPFVFDQMVTINGVNRPEGNPPLRSYDQNLQEDLAFYVHQIKSSTYIIEMRLEKLKTKGTNILVFLQREYHLE